MDNIIFRADKNGKPVDDVRWIGEFCSDFGEDPILKIQDNSNKTVDLKVGDIIYYSDKDLEQSSGIFMIQQKYADRYSVRRC